MMWLIQNENGRIVERALAMAAAVSARLRAHAPLSYVGIVPIWHFSDELVGPCSSCGSMISSKVALGLPYAIFSATVPLNKNTSCNTMPNADEERRS